MASRSATAGREQRNRLLLRARDAMDRAYVEPLDLPTLASIACLSESAFLRAFKTTFGETPHRYLQRRRIERAMYLLRTTDQPITRICLDVGFTSLGTFSRTFTDVVGCAPTAFRDRSAPVATVPSCFVKAWTRPAGFGEAPR